MTFIPVKDRAKVEADARTRAQKALALVQAGATWEQVAEECGYANRGTAFNVVHRLLTRVETEGVEALREKQGARLERLHMAHWAAALKGDLKATLACLKIYERQARLYGTDAPLKVDARMSDATDQSIRELAEQLGMAAPEVQIPVE